MEVSHREFTAALTVGHRYSPPRRVELQHGTDRFSIADMRGNLASYDADLLDYLFWAANVRGLAQSTLRVRMDFLHRLYLFAAVPLRNIEPHHLLAFERVAIAGRAAESRRAYSSHLRSFFRWCVKNGICSVDPTEVLTMPKVPRHLPRPIDEDDLVAALAAARPKMAAMITLAAYGGLRCCELAGLDWSDVRRESDGSAFLHVRKGKGSRERIVEVGQVVIQALQRYGIKRRGAVFVGYDGAQMAAGSVSRSINRFLAAHEIPATAHQLRHRYGVLGYQVSRDLRLLQEQLGHASPSTTAIYTRASQEAARNMVAALDALATPAPRTGPAPAAAAL